MLDLKTFIRDVPDFPKPGITFKDIAPLLADHAAFEATIDGLAAEFKGKGIEVIAAAEARGFLFAPPLAMKLGVGVVPVRKPGKLPFETHSYQYDLEYGTDTLEIHTDAIQPGQKVLVVDDLLATGGTVSACCKLIEQCGGEIVGCGFVIHLAFLDGQKMLEKYPVFSLMSFD